MADDLERLLAGDRRPHHLLDVLGFPYFERVHALAGSQIRGRNQMCASNNAAMPVPVMRASRPPFRFDDSIAIEMFTTWILRSWPNRNLRTIDTRPRWLEATRTDGDNHGAFECRAAR